MLNVIPRFIQRRHTAGEDHGSLERGVLFVDISGFTAITERLMENGTQGAEVLSELINRTFRPLIRKVHRAGGFVVSFAGDAFTALLPDAQSAVRLALDIQESFAGHRGRKKTPLGEFDLSCRIGGAHGEVEWGIFRDPRTAVYYFRGEPIRAAAAAIEGTERGSAAFDDSLTMSGSGRPLVIAPEERAPRSRERLRPSVVRRFVPEEVLHTPLTGEFRDVAPVFVGFRGMDDHSSLSAFIEDVVAEVERYGGYLNGLFFGDKGPNLFVIFGAPVSYEHNTRRAAGFARALQERLGDRIRAGLTHGRVYAGITGSRRRCNYTALGSTVNLAARLFTQAPWGAIWTAPSAAKLLDAEFAFDEVGVRELKGFAAGIEILSLRELTRRRTVIFGGRMLGRVEETAELERFFAPLERGRCPGVHYLYGEAGMGKSRLAFEFARRLQPRVRGLVMQVDGILRRSFNPLIYALERYLDLNPELDTEEFQHRFTESYTDLLNELRACGDGRAEAVATELERLRSVLAALLDIQQPGSLYEELDARGRFENTIYAFKEFFKALALLQPTLLVLEDLQWIDDDSRGFFTQLLRNIEDYPLGLLVTSRFTDDGDRPVLELDNEVPRGELIVENLPRRAAEDLLGELLEAEAEAELRSFILERTQANPFYLEQFCRFLQESDFLEKTPAGLRLKERPEELPSGIRAVLIARLDRLSRELRELVQTASILGREFEVSVLSSMLQGESLSPLLVDGRNEALWSALSEILYIFKHALLRDAAYEMQLVKRRRELHALAAEALLSLHGGPPSHYAELAYHYEQAGDLANAREYLGKAADHARSEYHHQEALEYLERLLPLLEDAEKLRRRKIDRAVIWEESGNWKAAEAFYREDLEWAEEHGKPAELAEALADLASLLTHRGEHDEAEGLYERGLDLGLDGADRHYVVDYLTGLGTINYNRGAADEARGYYERAIELAEELGLENKTAKLLSNIGNTYVNQGDLERAAEHYQRSVERCKELELLRDGIPPIYNLGGVAYFTGDYEEAMARFREAHDLAVRVGDKRTMSMTLGGIGSVYADLHDYEESERHHRGKLTLSRELGDKRGVMYSLANLGILELYKNNLNEALRLHRRELAMAEEMGDKTVIAKASEQIGNVLYRTGDLAECEEHYLRAVEMQRETGNQRDLYPTLQQLGRFYQKLGRPAEALEIYDEALEIASKMGKPRDLGLLLCNRALTLRDMNRFNEVRELLKGGLEHLSQPELIRESVEWLLQLADFEFEYGETADARQAHAGAVELLEGIEKPGELLTKERLTAVRLLGETNPEAALELCRSLGETITDEELGAEAAFELYRLTNDETDRRAAAKRFTKLHDKRPLAHFKRRLTQLGKQTTPPG